MSPTKNAREDLPELMYVRCASCGKWMDVKPGQVSGVSHGICENCFDRAMKKIEKEDQPRPS